MERIGESTVLSDNRKMVLLIKAIHQLTQRLCALWVLIILSEMVRHEPRCFGGGSADGGKQDPCGRKLLIQDPARYIY